MAVRRWRLAAVPGLGLRAVAGGSPSGGAAVRAVAAFAGERVRPGTEKRYSRPLGAEHIDFCKLSKPRGDNAMIVSSF